jgi:hypothetical protein
MKLKKRGKKKGLLNSTGESGKVNHQLPPTPIFMTVHHPSVILSETDEYGYQCNGTYLECPLEGNMPKQAVIDPSELHRSAGKMLKRLRFRLSTW